MCSSFSGQVALELKRIVAVFGLVLGMGGNKKPRNEYEGSGSRCGTRKPGSQGWEGGCPAGTLKRWKGMEEMGGKKEKLEEDEERQVGIYVSAKRRGAAPGARYPIGGTPNPAGPTPTTKLLYLNS